MILIDPLRWAPAVRPRVRRDRERWAHMVATGGPDELHPFADMIGLRREWYQAHPRHPHYDIRPRQWHRAREAGALLVASRSLVRLEAVPICRRHPDCLEPSQLALSFDMDLPAISVCSVTCAAVVEQQLADRLRDARVARR